jgi:hypothetical protein
MGNLGAGRGTTLFRDAAAYQFEDFGLPGSECVIGHNGLLVICTGAVIITSHLPNATILYHIDLYVYLVISIQWRVISTRYCGHTGR